MPRVPGALEKSIYHTIRYFSLFDMPVTAVQIWRSLVLEHVDGRQRWQGQHLPRLREIRETLEVSSWLATRVGTRWGYFFLQEQEGGVRRRLDRHVTAQHKWRLTKRLAKWLALVPLVRMAAGSGSLSLSNTKLTSDLDVFIVAARGRIWTTRLLLLFLAQLLGRRRKRWDRLAPDRLCFNHFVSGAEMTMKEPVRNLYTAVAYTHLVPLFASPTFFEFEQANATWMKTYLMYPDVPHLFPKQAVSLPSPLLYAKQLLENLLLEPIGEVVERWAEKWQRRSIEEHSHPGRPGRISVSNTELAFHPDSRVPEILRQFSQEEGQKALL